MKKLTSKMTRILAMVLICAMVLPFAACRRDNGDPTASTADPTATMTYTVTVRSAGGMALSGVGVYIYEDATKAELVWYDQTGEDGTMRFTDLVRDSYVAVLADVPTGYAVEEFYPITGQSTEIVLQAGQMGGENTDELIYKLGDMVMDFTVTGPDGTQYTLSELLKQKKAVVLNFWYIECAPCNMEFPFLQEAYEQYADDIALLAMNPINDEQAIADFQKEKGYTFPMVSCGSQWEKIMGIAAYPTTVIIDRFGNICLIHKGSIDNTKTFADAFAYFAAEEYEQKLIQDILELATEEEEGTKDNPQDATGQTSFEIAVEPGQEIYTELYKARGMYLSIKGQSKDFYVIYNDKTYTPDSSNTVGFVISTGDNYTPAVFGVGNTGDTAQTYKASLSFLPGTFNNPYSMSLGEFTVNVSAGNEQGVNYVYYAPENGSLSVQCLSSTAGVEYGYTLYNTTTMAVRSLEEDGAQEDGTVPTLSIAANKGDRILFTVATLPDEEFSYPAGSFRFLASYEEGEGATVDKVEKIDYTVTVTDENGQPLKDISVWLTKDGETASAKTDEQGIVTLNLVKGVYSGTVSVPEGYTLENNAFELTEEAAAATVVLTTAVDTRADYTVTVTDPAGNPVAGAEVLIMGAGSSLTDENGTVTVKLEPGTYSVLLGTLPAGFTCSDMLTLTAESLQAEFILSYIPGTHPTSPIMLLEEDNTLTNTGTVWYGTRFSGTTMQITGQAGFTVQLDGVTYPDTDGTFTTDIYSADPRMPVTFAITGEGEFRISFVYPEGHRMNPAVMILGSNSATLEAGSDDYFFNWTAIGTGELTITMDADAQWLYAVSNLTTGITGDTCWSDDAVPAVSQSIFVTAGDVIQVAVNTYNPANMFQNPAGTVSFDASFVWTIDQVPFTTAFIDGGSSYTYRVTGVSGSTMTIDDAYAYVICGSVTYGADASGKVTVPMGTDDTVAMVIGNCGAEAASYAVNFTWPTGSLRNPASLKFQFPQNVISRLTANDSDGYYYLFSPDRTGTLSFTKTSATKDYTVKLIRNGQEVVQPDAADSRKTVSMYVVPGDEILLYLQAVPGADGTYPATTVISKGTFEEDYSSYTVTFDPNGGELTGEATAETVDGKLAQLPSAPVRQGYEFLGWYSAAQGGNAVTTATIIKVNTTVYAQWAKAEYTVTFNPGAGQLTGEASALTADGKLTALPADPVLEGYTFNGWYDLPVGGNAITTDTVFTANTEIYAQWTGSGSDTSGQTVNYEVTVIDGDGYPITSGVYVTWQSADTLQTKVINNASGTASAALAADTYTILLTLTGAYQNYRYDAVSAIATAADPAVTIQVAPAISDTVTETTFSASSGDLVTKDLSLGSTYVKLGSSQSNYAVMDGKAYCFFRFVITEEGKYAFTTNNGAPISNWGTNTSFIENRTTEEEHAANTFQVEIKETNFSAEVHELQLIFAVEVTNAYADTIVCLKDAGDVEYTYLDAPFVVFEGTQTPEMAYESGKPVAIKENIFQLTTDGKQITYVDMLNDKPVKGEDGFYHLGSEDGPILYVNLGADAPYISLGSMVGAIGQYGTGFKKIFYNEDGTPEVNPDGTYHKEDYTDAMVAYALHADPTTGLYPLTDDLIYMIQHGGEFKGWYTPGSGTYLFEEQSVTVDPELIWMFAVCYLK